MDKKRRTLLITVAAVLLVVAIFLLPRRSQPLGELIPAPETARVDGLFYISTIVPTPDASVSTMLTYPLSLYSCIVALASS